MIDMKELIENLKRTVARAVGFKEPESPTARRVLFVCMGNICRSPTAEGVFRKLLSDQAPELEVLIDSAGTHGYHDGAPPDPRACRAAERRVAYGLQGEENTDADGASHHEGLRGRVHLFLTPRDVQR